MYVDTSVFGGACDEEFAAPSRRFFERAGNEEFVVLLSIHTIEELEPAPEQVRKVLLGLPSDCVETVPSDEEVDALAEAYIKTGALGRASQMDARHVAAATVAGADLILSWNYKHILRYDRIQMFNGVNVLKGYRPLDIRSPLEMGYEDEDV